MEEFAPSMQTSSYASISYTLQNPMGSLSLKSIKLPYSKNTLLISGKANNGFNKLYFGDSPFKNNLLSMRNVKRRKFELGFFSTSIWVSKLFGSFRHLWIALFHFRSSKNLTRHLTNIYLWLLNHGSSFSSSFDVRFFAEAFSRVRTVLFGLCTVRSTV